MNQKRVEVSYLWVIVLFVFLAVGMYFLFSPSDSGITGQATTDSQIGNLTVGVQTYMACTWSVATLNISFGSSLDPGSTNQNASGNFANFPTSNNTNFNVTVDTLSTSVADINVTGKNLMSSGSSINVENVTWQRNSTSAVGVNMVPAGGTSLSATSTLMFDDEAIGSTGHFRMWLDIPADAVAGTYVGNYTMLCMEG